MTMKMLRTWSLRLRSLFRKEQLDRELYDELQSHLEMHIEDNLRGGMSPEEARRDALLRLGGLEQTKETYRDRRGVPLLETLLQDLRFGLRMLLKNPGFAAVAVLTLALGIGANTAIFSLFNAVVLNTLPVAKPSELVLFSGSLSQGSSSGTQTGLWQLFSNEDYTYFNAHNGSFRELMAYQSNRNSLSVRVGSAQRRESARCNLVSGNFFSFLGLRAAAGRLLSPEDDQQSSSPVAVLNYAYWTQRFHTDPSAIGEAIEINGTPFTIVGVAPPDFSGVNYRAPSFWIPLAKQTEVIPGKMYANDPHEFWLNIVARLKPGVTLRHAQAVVNTQLKQVLYAQTDAHRETDQEIADSHIELAPGAGGISHLRIQYFEALQTLSFVVGIVLLMACANVANLLLSRSSAREKEISVRLAVGASRGKLIRQLLTESVLLATIGGATGVLAARWVAEVLVLLVTGSNTTVDPRLDVRVLAFSAAISVLAGVLFGLAPALRAGRMDLATPIKGSSHPRRRFGFPDGIVVFQIAGSVVLLVGAGLFVRTLQKLAHQDLGFDQEHILLARIDPMGAGYKPEQTPMLYHALIDRLEQIHGVRSVTVDSSNPLSGSSWSSNFSIEDQPARPTGEATVYKELVGPRYFETEGIPILLGRDIGPEDRAGTPLVTVINETMARKFFPGVNPVGKRFSLGSPFNAKEGMTIVGVAADARYYSVRDPVPPMEFAAAFQVPDSGSHNAGYASDVEIRTSGDPRAVASEIRPAVKEVANGLPVNSVILLQQQVSDALQQNRVAAELSSAFGVLALLLACTGLYGTLAYRVSRRMQEIGVRMALGAQRSSVLWLVTKEGLFLILPGLAIGLVVALGSTKIIASQLFGIGSNDFVTFAAMLALLLLVALAACWIPARRATRVDPLIALRYE